MESLNFPIITGTFDEEIPEKLKQLIPTEHHLPVVHDTSLQVLLNNTALWAYRTFAVCDHDVRKLYVNAAVAIINLGLIRYPRDVHDSKWRVKTEAELPPQGNESEMINSMISISNIKIAVMIIVATKANWWLTGYHIRDGHDSDHIQKVLKSFFGSCITSQLVNAANTIGQWASTLYTLELGGINQVKPTDPVVTRKDATLTLSEESRLMFSAMPAGTEPLTVSYEAARRLCISPYLRTCPSATDFLELLRMRHQVLSNPPLYHTEAKYLVENVAAQQVAMPCISMMGRLGTYIHMFLPNSKLALSPYFELSKVETYLDYSPQWKSTLQLLKKLHRDAPKTVLAEMECRYLNTEIECNTLKQKFLMGSADPVEV